MDISLIFEVNEFAFIEYATIVRRVRGLEITAETVDRVCVVLLIKAIVN
jgi:hypothetical protein